MDDIWILKCFISGYLIICIFIVFNVSYCNLIKIKVGIRVVLFIGN